MSVVKRHTFLKRHPTLTRAGFAEHYRHVHGPLAAAQPGFRRFTYRYIQNHVERSFLDNEDPLFDGITMTFQVPRPNYQQGFFQHPDYANVRPDEERLFDLAATVSLLGEEHILIQGTSTVGGAKAIVLSVADGYTELTGIATSQGIQACVRNDLDRGSASALGGGTTSFPYIRLWELWFATPEACLLACRDRPFIEALSGPDARGAVAFGVRDIVVFSDPTPDQQEEILP
jgi:hypothetical protein